MGAFSDTAALARAVCSTPIGLLTLVGESVVWCAGPGDQDQLVALSQSASAGTQAVIFEHRAESMYCAGVVLVSPRGEVLGRLCVMDDESRPSLTDEQKVLLRALGKLIVNHIESRRASKWRPLGFLAGGIAHDMNNALQTIVGALSTVGKLIETGNLERTPRFIAAAQRSAQRGGELTRSLQRLAGARPEGAKPLELNSLLVSMEDLFRRVCGERATLQLQLADHAGAVMCDPGELESVLLSLVINAVQVIVGTGEITISTGEARVGIGGPQSFEWGFARDFARRQDGTAGIEGHTVWISFQGGGTQ
jgi:C4-dicarboxylate-specific signal transduction histidine kinase